MKRMTISAALVAMMLSLGGCFGGDTEVKQSSVSKGQELTDLKKAFDSGAISEREYERMRKQVIDRRD